MGGRGRRKNQGSWGSNKLGGSDNVGGNNNKERGGGNINLRGQG